MFCPPPQSSHRQSETPLGGGCDPLFWGAWPPGDLHPLHILFFRGLGEFYSIMTPLALPAQPPQPLWMSLAPFGGLWPPGFGMCEPLGIFIPLKSHFWGIFPGFPCSSATPANTPRSPWMGRMKVMMKKELSKSFLPLLLLLSRHGNLWRFPKIPTLIQARQK